ncbi:MAG: ABC transporter permease [Cyanobacteria bacterium J06588_5]
METKSWWKKLKNNPLARAGAIMLIIFYVIVIFADFFAPYSPIEQQPNGSLMPPTRIYWNDQESGQFLGPHVYPTIQGAIDLDSGAQELSVDFARPAPLRLFVKGYQYNLFQLSIPYFTGISLEDGIQMAEWEVVKGIPLSWHLFGTVGEAAPAQSTPPAATTTENAPADSDTADSDILAPLEEPTGEASEEGTVATAAYINLLGTDNAARDVLSRLIYGGRISLSIGLVGIAISFPLGLLIGGISGYFGGIVDSVLMRVVEVIMSVPTFYLLVALSTILPPELGNSERFLLIILITSFIGWAGLARVIRGEVLSLKERTYVQASQSMGGRSLHIITRHILPQTATYVIIAATLSIPSYIVAEAVLSLVNLGISEPDPSWGNMLSASTNASILILNPWLIWPPAILIVITVLSFNILGDGLRDALDPRSLQE